MATISSGAGSSFAIPLSVAQTGNGASTNVANRGASSGPAAVVITTTVGATPTVTVSIQGSMDGTNFYNVPYALVATPSTFVVTDITITTAVTTTYLLQTDQAWDYLRLNLAANTNVTLTATAYVG